MPAHLDFSRTVGGEPNRNECGRRHPFEPLLLHRIPRQTPTTPFAHARIGYELYPFKARVIDLTTVVSAAAVPRRFRFRFWLIRAAKWLVPAWRCMALPRPDRRNRFLVPLCVFIFGMVQVPITYRYPLVSPVFYAFSRMDASRG